MSTLLRIPVCLWVFGYGAYALGHGVIGFIGAGIVALFVNELWKEHQQQTEIRRHREAVVADEQLRLDVRHRREQEGRTP
jgi:hypothetical protein